MKTIKLPHSLIHAGNLILVNAQYPYRTDLPWQELAPVHAGAPDIMLNDQVTRVLSCLMKKINGWNSITAVSGWRSMEEQVKIYEDSLRENGRRFTEQYVALPGHSEHQTGLAIDLAKTQENIDFIRPDFPYAGICQTFRQQALSYGFIERYPKEKETVTGISHEPWHFRYVGAPHAEIMSDKGMVLEEYLTFLKEYPYEKTSYQHQSGGTIICISYRKAAKDTDTLFTIDDRFPYSISGNNIDGFVLTQWRTAHENRS